MSDFSGVDRRQRSEATINNYYEELAAVLKADQRHISDDLTTIKTDLREMRSQIAASTAVLSALPAQYVTSGAFERLSERFTGDMKSLGERLESIFRANVDRIDRDLKAVAERADTLERMRDQASGGARWLYVGLGVVLILAQLANVALTFAAKAH